MLKKIAKASTTVALIGSLFFLVPPHFPTASATNPSETTFQVNVREVLSVGITAPTSWASGGVGQFLRNKITLDVSSNNLQGFTASMISSDANAELHHSSKQNTVLPTLSTSDPNVPYTCADASCAAFPANYWGYSVNDDSNTGAYNPMAKSSDPPITLISNAESLNSNSPKDIYFGAKSDASQASGTYSGTVVFYVVSGTINNENPAVPTNPATNNPGDTPTYANNNTVYTATTNNRNSNNEVVSTTTTTTINEGDARSSYSEPAGVTDSTSSNIYDGSMLATGLAVTASVAAATGLTFFVLAKRKKDDDEEETE